MIDAAPGLFGLLSANVVSVVGPGSIAAAAAAAAAAAPILGPSVTSLVAMPAVVVAVIPANNAWRRSSLGGGGFRDRGRGLGSGRVAGAERSHMRDSECAFSFFHAFCISFVYISILLSMYIFLHSYFLVFRVSCTSFFLFFLYFYFLHYFLVLHIFLSFKFLLLLFFFPCFYAVFLPERSFFLLSLLVFAGRRGGGGCPSLFPFWCFIFSTTTRDFFSLSILSAYSQRIFLSGRGGGEGAIFLFFLPFFSAAGRCASFPCPRFQSKQRAS